MVGEYSIVDILPDGFLQRTPPGNCINAANSGRCVTEIDLTACHYVQNIVSIVSYCKCCRSRLIGLYKDSGLIASEANINGGLAAEGCSLLVCYALRLELCPESQKGA